MGQKLFNIKPLEKKEIFVQNNIINLFRGERYLCDKLYLLSMVQLLGVSMQNVFFIRYLFLFKKFQSYIKTFGDFYANQ